MDAVKFSIQKPVTIVVGVILVVMFGVIGLLRMPYQLSPTVIEPEITVTTHWSGATPYEIERVDGVADLFIGGGIEREMHIIVAPEKLAAYGLTITDLISIPRSENINVSAGVMGVGRRDYRNRISN